MAAIIVDLQAAAKRMGLKGKARAKLDPLPRVVIGGGITVNVANTVLSTNTLFNVTAANREINGDVGELMYLNYALSQSDREKLEGYLAHKWDTDGSLPGGHPYKSAAP